MTQRLWMVIAGVWVLPSAILFLTTASALVQASDANVAGTGSPAAVVGEAAMLGLWGTLGLIGLIVCLFQWRARAEPIRRPRPSAT